jgi:hypothetical protein
MTWWAVGVAVVSAGIGMYNADKTAERQDKNLAMQIKNQSKQQQGAESKIREMMDKLGKSDSKDEEKQRMDQYLSTLQMGAQANGINQGAGGFSDAYRQDAAKAAAGLEDFGVNRAGLLARTDAPGLQRVNEGILFDQTAFDVKGIGRNANQQQYLDNLALNAIRPDPWLTAASELGGAYAGAAMGGGGKSKSSGIGPVEPEKIDVVF